MSAHMSKDPWSTGDRAGYTPPPVQRRVQAKKQSFSMARLLRTVLVIVGLLWAFNYAVTNHYFPGL